MSIFGTRDSGTKIVATDLLLNFDAAELRSYTSGSTVWNSLIPPNVSGSLINGPTFSTAGGGTIVFDGTNDRVDITQNLANFTGGITLEAWVYATNTTDFARILELGNGNRTNNIGFFRINANNFLGVFMQYPDGVNSTLDIGVNNVYQLNTWHNLAFTANGTNWRLFKNGSQVATQTQSYLPTNTTRAINTIGSTSGAYREFFGGNIPIVRVYNRALSATELLQNFNALRVRFGI